MRNTYHLFVGSIVIQFDNSVFSITTSHSEFCPLVDLCSLPRTVTSAPVGLSFELRPVSMWALTHWGRWRVKTVKWASIQISLIRCPEFREGNLKQFFVVQLAASTYGAFWPLHGTVISHVFASSGKACLVWLLKRDEVISWIICRQ